MPEPNTVYIGKKPTMNYVLAVVTQFNTGSAEVIVKARGRSIARAVDVAEIVRNRFVPGSKVRDVRIATERLTGDDGKTASVSSIEIILNRPPNVSGPRPEPPHERGLHKVVDQERGRRRIPQHGQNLQRSDGM